MNERMRVMVTVRLHILTVETQLRELDSASDFMGAHFAIRSEQFADSGSEDQNVRPAVSSDVTEHHRLPVSRTIWILDRRPECSAGRLNVAIAIWSLSLTSDMYEKWS